VPKFRAPKTFTFGYDMSELNAFEPAGQFVVTANLPGSVSKLLRGLMDLRTERSKMPAPGPETAVIATTFRHGQRFQTKWQSVAT
jgi:hypothetical protein